MRTMYDGITPSGLPNDGQLYASYVDGQWPNFSQLEGLFPKATHVSIATSASTDAMVLDVERFDATPEESVDWAVRQREHGGNPTVYCNGSALQAVKDAFHARNVPEPQYWVANWDGNAEVPNGTVAKQYENTANFDKSAVADNWPGVDVKDDGDVDVPAPTPKPAPSGGNEYTVKDGDTLSSIAQAHGIADWHTLYNANRDTIGADPNLIHAGLVLDLSEEPSEGAKPGPTTQPHPAVGGYVVQAGDTLSGIAEAHHIADWHTLYDHNRSVIGNNPDDIFPGQRLVLP